jgi:hypothetical protein
MKAPNSYAGWAMAVAAVFTTGFCGPLVAGEADPEPDDTHIHGPAYFGETKEVPSLEAVTDVRVKGQVRGTYRFFVLQSDDHGRFRRSGMGLDVDANKVEFTCDKAGYKTVDVSWRRLSPAKDAPVEVECLMVKE